MMQNHYVPRKYLRGFCEPGSDEMLWRYDKVYDHLGHRSIGAVAKEAGFYSDEVEAKLNTLVEMPANAVLDKLRAGESIEIEERGRLAMYIATMVKRVPRFRIQAQSILPKALTETIRNVKEAFEQIAAQGNINSATLARHLAETDTVEERLRVRTPDEIVEQIRCPAPTMEQIQFIFGMKWRLLSTTGPSFFLTSDNPAFFFMAYGVGSELSEIRFPISTTLLLHGCWQDGPEYERIVATQQLVKEFNRSIASAATRYLFYYQRAEWIRLVARKREQTELSRISWR